FPGGGLCFGYTCPSLNDVWVLTNANGLGGTSEWIQLFPSGGPPAARYGNTAVYDSATNRLMVYGGWGNPGYLHDTWILTNANGVGGSAQWIQPTTGGNPDHRISHTAAFYSSTTLILLFAGGGLCFGCYCSSLNDVWVLTNANGFGGTSDWIQLFSSG